MRKMGVNNWKQTTQERKKWKEIIEQAKNSQRVVELKKKKKNLCDYFQVTVIAARVIA